MFTRTLKSSPTLWSHSGTIIFGFCVNCVLVSVCLFRPSGTFSVWPRPSLTLPLLASIPPSSVPPVPPTGSTSFSVSLTVAPQLLCMLSWVTWINDSSRGFTEQARPLHNPGRSAAVPRSFLTLNAQHCTTTPSTSDPFYPHSSSLPLYHCTQHMVQWVCCHMASVTSIYPEPVRWIYFWTQKLGQ